MASGVYSNFKLQVLKKAIDLSDTTPNVLKYALLGNGYTPNLDTDTVWSGISVNEVSGTGYTAGGKGITTPAVSQIAANSWTGVWANSTTYVVSQIVRPITGNGFLYKCVQGGQSQAAGNPSWGTTVGETTSDNSGAVIWLNIGTSAIRFTADNPQWTNVSVTAYFGVLYHVASGILICVDDFGGPFGGTNISQFTITIDGAGGLLDIS